MAKISTYPASGKIQATDKFVIARAGANYAPTGLEVVGYTITAAAAAFSPADSTTYYFGTAFSQAPLTTADVLSIPIPRAGTVTRIAVRASYFTGVGTAEVSTLYFRLNGTTDTIITAAFQNNANAIYTATGLAIAVAAGDTFQIKWITPAWVTNPLGVVFYVQVFVQ